MHVIEVSLKDHLPDARGLGLVKDIRDLGITTVSNARVLDIYWLDADLDPETVDLICRSLLADNVTQDFWHGTTSRSVDRKYHAVEVAYNPGVIDPVEGTVMKAIRDLGISGVRAVRTAKKYLIEGNLDESQLDLIARRLLVNPVVQHVVKQAPMQFPEPPQYQFKLDHVEILKLSPAELQALGRKYGFFPTEINAIAEYFQKQGRNPTDSEMETLSQTWSEHCVHKTFR
ncbi:MAG: phosphoribosylformylglycinamidine synthase subunit PurS, partial [Chloroflexi bacterium]|nr:phosphoribosylformylglycinamidine synthase subunit PurS [Chloroflexota bacterium]